MRVMRAPPARHPCRRGHLGWRGRAKAGGRKPLWWGKLESLRGARPRIWGVPVTKTVVTLEDKYAQDSGQVFLTSLQALVRLPLEQARRDRAAGLKTAGYVTGYRGSPITTLDAQLWAAKKLLDAHDIHFEPGLNEELAATSLRGTQQVHWFGKSPYQGVFAMWYAKGLGV